MRAKSTFKCKLWMYNVTTAVCFFERARPKNKCNSYNFQVERLTDMEQHKTTFLFLLYSLWQVSAIVFQHVNSLFKNVRIFNFDQN